MSQTLSPSVTRCYGMARVASVWKISRASVYRSLKETPPNTIARRPGPVGACSDAELAEHIRQHIAACRLHGEGYRKLWARLRFAGVRTSPRRVRRVMRENGLLAPHRVGRTEARPHDGTIITDKINEMWGTDMTQTITIREGRANVFVAVEHANSEMFGLTAGAVFVYLHKERFRPERLSYDLAVATLAFALTTDLAIVVQLTLVTGASPSLTSLVAWAEFALCLAFPFFFSGVVVSLALTRGPYPIGKVYGADLIGAAMGCIGALVLLNMTSGPSAVLWVGAVTGLAALGFANSGLGNLHESASLGGKLFRCRRIILTGCLLFAIANPLTTYGVRPTLIKDHLEAPADLAYDRWNSFSRITVAQSNTGPPAMWGPSPRLPRSTIEHGDLAHLRGRTCGLAP